MSVLQGGSLFMGRYRVLQALGQGALDYAYLVKDIEAGRPVVLEITPAALSRSSVFAGGLKRRADLLVQAAHPQVVQVYDVGLSESGEPYITLQHIEGDPLREVLRRTADTDRPFSTRRALSIAVLPEAKAVVRSGRVGPQTTQICRRMRRRNWRAADKLGAAQGCQVALWSSWCRRRAGYLLFLAPALPVQMGQ